MDTFTIPRREYVLLYRLYCATKYGFTKPDEIIEELDRLYEAERAQATGRA